MGCEQQLRVVAGMKLLTHGYSQGDRDGDEHSQKEAATSRQSGLTGQLEVQMLSRGPLGTCGRAMCVVAHTVPTTFQHTWNMV